MTPTEGDVVLSPKGRKWTVIEVLEKHPGGPAMTPEEEALIRKRAEQHTEVLAVADRRHLLAELDRLRAEKEKP